MNGVTEWRAVQGLPYKRSTLYVSDRGGVMVYDERRGEYVVKRQYNNQTAKNSQRRPNWKPYQMVNIRFNEKGEHYILHKFVHRLVADAFGIPGREDQKQVDHIDGNKKNNAVFNLRRVTKSENMCAYFAQKKELTVITNYQKARFYAIQ